MSRFIPGKAVQAEEATLRNTEAGKLIITDCKGHRLICLVKENRLLHVSVLDTSTGEIGTIFLGKVKKVVPNIDACFIEIREKELVFLPLSDSRDACLTNRKSDGRILEGDELPVQVVRDALKTKQAAATTKLSIAGRYMVFRVGVKKVGISEKLTDVQRKDLLKILQAHRIIDPEHKLILDQESNNMDTTVPMNFSGDIPNYSIILRTEAATASEEQLLNEFYTLRHKFLQIFSTARYRTCYTKLYAKTSVCETAVSQIASEYNEVVTDQTAIYEDMKDYFLERNISIRLYTDQTYPLHRLYSLETKLEDALGRRIWLKSGAYLIIDVTEALTVIDVNSGKYDAKKASEEAIYLINQEAAKEIALQMRLRNLSGIILIDFINMTSAKYQGQLLKEMRNLVQDDKILTKVIDITPLGLMEITRKKVNKTLEEQLKAKKRSEVLS